MAGIVGVRYDEMPIEPVLGMPPLPRYDRFSAQHADGGADGEIARPMQVLIEARQSDERRRGIRNRTDNSRR